MHDGGCAVGGRVSPGGFGAGAGRGGAGSSWSVGGHHEGESAGDSGGAGGGGESVAGGRGANVSGRRGAVGFWGGEGDEIWMVVEVLVL